MCSASRRTDLGGHLKAIHIHLKNIKGDRIQPLNRNRWDIGIWLIFYVSKRSPQQTHKIALHKLEKNFNKIECDFMCSKTVIASSMEIQ